ncbi:MAG: hypothetical protein R2788_25295 [Saprospiraceae bacterium]
MTIPKTLTTRSILSNELRLCRNVAKMAKLTCRAGQLTRFDVHVLADPANDD